MLRDPKKLSFRVHESAGTTFLSVDTDMYYNFTVSTTNPEVFFAIASKMKEVGDSMVAALTKATKEGQR